MYRLEINDAELDRAFAGLASALSDLSKPMAEIGEMMVHSTQARMLAGKSPDGTPFAPRSPVTLAQYARKGQKPGAKPLWLTGTMRSNIAYRAGADFAEIGSNAIQAAVMQFGAQKGAFKSGKGRTTPWGNIPSRPYLGVTEADIHRVIEVIDEWLTGSSAN